MGVVSDGGHSAAYFSLCLQNVSVSVPVVQLTERWAHLLIFKHQVQCSKEYTKHARGKCGEFSFRNSFEMNFMHLQWCVVGLFWFACGYGLNDRHEIASNIGPTLLRDSYRNASRSSFRIYQNRKAEATSAVAKETFNSLGQFYSRDRPASITLKSNISTVSNSAHQKSGQRSSDNHPTPQRVTGNKDSQPLITQLQHSAIRDRTGLNVPLLWTTVGIALGFKSSDQTTLQGLPCVKRLNQVFCRNQGSQYPGDEIEKFIDDNKALIRRMFGETVEQNPEATASGYARSRRPKRQTTLGRPQRSELVDSCQSKVEVLSPYWAANSAGKLRAIVNTKHFPQAIHQEICTGNSTSRCGGQCKCEQKMTYHRLLAYDASESCKGIFIDWFLFPSCCACRCLP